MQISDLESRLIVVIWTFAALVVLAILSIVLLTHANTFAIADALIRWFAPHASAQDISKLHILGRDLGHFVIPAAAYLALVTGPLRNRPYLALGLCAMFAVFDEALQTFSPGRTGSVYDIAIDMAGALCAFLMHSVMSGDRRRAVRAPIRSR
jgi:VanZ family protein